MRMLCIEGGSTINFVVVLTTLLFQVTCCRKTRTCAPSSCGNIRNITYPFRLRGDPPNCGHPGYELVCNNNRTLIRTWRGRPFHSNGMSYRYVEEINYANRTIRLVDPRLHDVHHHCSSLSLSLFSGSFPDDDFDLDPYIHHLHLHRYYSIPVIHIECRDPVISTRYMDMRCHCEMENTSSSYSYSYLVVGEMMITESDLLISSSCKINKVVSWLSSRHPLNSSCSEIHKSLLYGTELYWPTYFYSTDTLWYIRIILILITLLLELTALALAGRFVVGVIFLLALVIYKLKRRHLSTYNNIEDFLQSQNSLVPIRYSYSKIKKITNGFKHKLGEGGYGSVYKGKLQSGILVAVKIMGKSKATGQEFINEVSTIGRIHHVNVVRLVGFCFEGSKRALIYEFMPNGSLEKYILPPVEERENEYDEKGAISLSYETMYDISIKVARGIEYLHRGCDMQILHFDIKPHNILLDEAFSPKISDFGLAKLSATDDSIVTMTAARGTMGYMAPELFYKNIGGVSYKADVYSFGMLLMEMAGRRKNLNPFADHLSQIYFPSWVYDQLIEGNDIEEVMEDATDGEKMLVKKMIIVALWCIQMKPNERPSMNKVLEMLEGDVERLEMPPKPFLCPPDVSGEPEPEAKPEELTS